MTAIGFLLLMGGLVTFFSALWTEAEMGTEFPDWLPPVLLAACALGFLLMLVGFSLALWRWMP